MPALRGPDSGKDWVKALNSITSYKVQLIFNFAWSLIFFRFALRGIFFIEILIGAGYVGSIIAYTIINWGLISEISLIDIDEKRAKGKMMDLSHGASFVKPVKIRSGGYEKCREDRIIIITAGVNQKPGETRLSI